MINIRVKQHKEGYVVDEATSTGIRRWHQMELKIIDRTKKLAQKCSLRNTCKKVTGGSVELSAAM